MCGENGDWKRALKLLWEMRRSSSRPGIFACGVVMAALERRKRWTEALAIAEEAGQVELTPDTAFCNAVASVVGRARDWNRALQVLGTCLRAALESNVKTYTTAIGAPERGVAWERMCRLFA